jgi:hypothetical protein
MGASHHRREDPFSASPSIRLEIAATAARLVADGALDYASAKRKAARLLLGEANVPRGAMPDNDEVDEALREHLDLFDEDHAGRVARMRHVALQLMHELAGFRPYLTGAVWKGIVAEHAPIHLQLFHDDTKDVQIHLLDRGMDFDATEVPHFRADGQKGGARDVEALAFVWQDEPVLLSLYRADDLRGALKADPPVRGDAAALERLLGPG